MTFHLIGPIFPARYLQTYLIVLNDAIFHRMDICNLSNYSSIDGRSLVYTSAITVLRWTLINVSLKALA